MGQIADLDFRIRDRVVQLLRRLANDQRACPACSRNAALQLATCVKIGFGVMADEADCQRLLAYSGKSNTDLESIISSLQGSGGGDIQSLRMLSLVMSGYFLLDEVSGNTQYIGDLATPLHTLEQELDSVLACLGPNHLVTWSLFSSLSARYERIEDYKHGEVLCRKAIAQYDQQIIISTGEDQEISKTRRALMLRNLAKILLDTSKLPEALQVAEDGIAEYEAINKGAVLDMQDAKRILARVHAGLGSYEKAIMIVEQLLESQLQTLDQQHWSVKSTREVLAEVLMERSSYSEAERVLLQLLDGMTEMTTDIANLKHRLGNLYWFQDRFTDSLTQLEEVKRFWESYGRRLGIVAPEYAPLLLDMADTLFSLDRFEDALPFARKAVTVSENLSDQTHDRAFGTLVDIRCSLQISVAWKKLPKACARQERSSTARVTSLLFQVRKDWQIYS
jgi:tetratricopeptide (TPR) repeat protein